jgi:hypothetical protein
LPVGLGILNLGIVKLGLSMSNGFGYWHLVIEILLRIMSDGSKLVLKTAMIPVFSAQSEINMVGFNYVQDELQRLA